jgi:cytochrome c oxidase assembly protein subunit 11
MPVVFFLDPKLEQDPYLKKLRDVTLAYTFFQVENDPETALATVPAIKPAEAGQDDGS